MTIDYKREPKIQGQDSIVINAPASQVWPLIRDSKEMENWGPPVVKVEVFHKPGTTIEGVGTKRKVYAKFTEKRKGWYEEIRTEQVEGRKVTFLIYEDSFGMAKMVEDVGASMEVVPEGEHKCRFIFTFYHRPKNLLGFIMNPMIKMDQKKNRAKALASIKSFVETGKAFKN